MVASAQHCTAHARCRLATAMPLALVMLALTFVALPTEARPGSNPSSTDRVIDAAITEAVLFSDRERDILRDYLREEQNNKPKSLPPGLRKRLDRGKDLPPGWQDKVQRGEVLDADLYRYSRTLPREIRRRLPDQPEGTRLRMVDDRIVRLAETTNIVLDVLTLD